MSTKRDRTIAGAIASWFQASARVLPWRRDVDHPHSRDASGRDPYHSLVSELMLQQTQVSRVLEKFEPFIARFPTVESLARAREQSVLAAWSGLGYYRRARLLHAAAKAIVQDHGAVVPRGLDELQTLPGIGRYTAGALASIVFGEAAPIVDGNVSRVLVRIEGRDIDESERDRTEWVWDRSEALVAAAADHPGAFTEGMMELGAVVCTPVAPRCDECPVAPWCRARAKGIQNELPPTKKSARRRAVHHAVVLVRDERTRLLVEQRPETGLWAGMWQAPTLERDDRAPSAKALAGWLGVEGLKRVEAFDHITSHRLVHFTVWRGEIGSGAAPNRGIWKSVAEVSRLPLSNPQRRLLLGVESEGRRVADSRKGLTKP